MTTGYEPRQVGNRTYRGAADFPVLLWFVRWKSEDILCKKTTANSSFHMGVVDPLALYYG